MLNQKKSRRDFLSTAGLTLAATQFNLWGEVNAQAGTGQRKIRSPAKPAMNTYGLLKQIDAGVLNVGYAEEGPIDGPVVILLHGWPYDIHSFVDVTPLLVAAGYRVIIPYLRGYGTTRFLSDETMRNGQQSVFAVDTIALMDALKIQEGNHSRV